MNMKAYVDAVNTASARVSDTARQIDELLNSENMDGALALQPKLDQAKIDYDKANQQTYWPCHSDDDSSRSSISSINIFFNYCYIPERRRNMALTECS